MRNIIRSASTSGPRLTTCHPAGAIRTNHSNFLFRLLLVERIVEDHISAQVQAVCTAEGDTHHNHRLAHQTADFRARMTIGNLTAASCAPCGGVVSLAVILCAHRAASQRHVYPIHSGLKPCMPHFRSENQHCSSFTVCTCPWDVHFLYSMPTQRRSAARYATE